MTARIGPHNVRSTRPIGARGEIATVSIRRVALVLAHGEKLWTMDPAVIRHDRIVEYAWMVEVNDVDGKARRIVRRQFAAARSDAHGIMNEREQIDVQVIPPSAEDWKYDLISGTLISLPSNCS